VRSHDRHFRLTTQEIDDVVRALTMVAENLENDAARQSMQEAFAQVRAYAAATRASSVNPAGTAFREVRSI
jgi:alkylhydroperoxidase/carboxymuconolactone decarboxylase family protein YurZ